MVRKKPFARDIGEPTRRILAGKRVERGFTQRQVSKELDKSDAWANLLERGQYIIKLQDFVDLCFLYDKDPLQVLAEILSWKASSQHLASK
jgi:transcriptional regulator with XRE-family HTH domain